VLGAWKFAATGETTVVVTFKPDGTFSQRRVGSTGKTSSYGGGTWQLDDPFVYLHGYAPIDNFPHRENTWHFRKIRGTFELEGGDIDDPDHWRAVHRVRK
jgi:hypothetical protein